MRGQYTFPWYKARVESQNLSPEITDQDRLLLVFAYLGPLSLFSLLATRKEFVKWHAKQGLVLSVAIAAVAVLAKSLHLLLRKVLWSVLAELYWVGVALVGLGIVLALLLCIVRALEGERFRIPMLGDLADRF
jgi:uncharacterized membrane protein